MWREFVEGTTEWGALTLARHEFQALEPPTWTDEEEFVFFYFHKYWTLFSKNWKLPKPLDNDVWRTSSFGDLSASNLSKLSMALERRQEYDQFTT